MAGLDDSDGSRRQRGAVASLAKGVTKIWEVSNSQNPASIDDCIYGIPYHHKQTGKRALKTDQNHNLDPQEKTELKPARNS